MIQSCEIPIVASVQLTNVPRYRELAAKRLQKDRTFDFNPGIWIEFMQIKTFCNFVGTRPNIHWSDEVTARRLGQWNSPAASGNVYRPDVALRESEFDVVSRWLRQPARCPLTHPLLG